MNIQLPNKLQLYIDKLKHADFSVADAAISGREDEIRLAIDARRQARAHLEREAMAALNLENATVEDIYFSNKELEDFIDLWCGKLNDTKFSTNALANIEYCHCFIDYFIPKTWGWDKDLLVLVHPQDNKIIEALIQRGQKTIVVFNESEFCNKMRCDFDQNVNLRFCTTPMELAGSISKINNRVRHVTTLSCDPFRSDANTIIADVKEAIVLGRKIAQVGVNTRSKFSKSWVKNILENLPNMSKRHSLADLSVFGVEDAIVVAPGPSLERNITELKKLEHSVFIVAPLRCVQMLNSHGIQPDLVVQIDSLDNEHASNLNFKNLPHIKNLLLEGSVSPSLFQISAENIFWTLQDNMSGIHNLLNSPPTPFTAPSVAIYATNVCKYFGFKNICLLGQDLAATGSKVYASGATDFLPQSGNAEQFTIPIKGFWGDQVYTRGDYEFYIEQYSILAELWIDKYPDMNLVNCTEGGAYIAGFRHLTLREFAAERNLNGCQREKALHFPNELHDISAKLDSYTSKLVTDLNTVVKISDKIIKLEKSDQKTSGLSKKIGKLVSHFQEIQNRTGLLELAMQDEITQVVGNASKTSSRPDYADFFISVRHTAFDLLKTLKA